MQSRFLSIPAMLVAAALASALATGPARANALGDAWRCTKGAAGSAISISEELAKKAEDVAAITGSAAYCTAAAGNPTPYAVTTAALASLRAAKPSLFSTGKGSCLKGVQNLVARPFGEGVHMIIPGSPQIPLGVIKTELAKILASEGGQDYIWQAMSSGPAQLITSQVECACTSIDAAIDLADYREIASAIKAASKSCAAVLDDVNGALKDVLGIDVADDLQEAWHDAKGFWLKIKHTVAPDMMGPEEAYAKFFAPYVTSRAERAAIDSGWVAWKGEDGGGNAADIWGRCADYYNNYSLTTEVKNLFGGKSVGQQFCDPLRDARFYPTVAARAKHLKNLIDLRGKVMTGMYARFDKDPWIKNKILVRMPREPAGVTMPGEMPKPESFAYPNKAVARVYLMDSYIGTATDGDKPWNWHATGAYKAAYDAVKAGADPDKALDLAYAAIGVHFQERVRARWDDHKEWVSAYWLGVLIPPAGKSNPFGVDTTGGPYNCPNAEPAKGACVKAVHAAFDKSCHKQIADAVTGSRPPGSSKPAAGQPPEMAFLNGLKPFADCQDAIKAATAPYSDMAGEAEKLIGNPNSLGFKKAAHDLCALPPEFYKVVNAPQRDRTQAAAAGAQTPVHVTFEPTCRSWVEEARSKCGKEPSCPPGGQQKPGDLCTQKASWQLCMGDVKKLSDDCAAQGRCLIDLMARHDRCVTESMKTAKTAASLDATAKDCFDNAVRTVKLITNKESAQDAWDKMKAKAANAPPHAPGAVQSHQPHLDEKVKELQTAPSAKPPAPGPAQRR